MISSELKLSNQEWFVKRVGTYGLQFNELYTPELIGNASWDMSTAQGLGYEGSMLQVVLRTLIPTALKIAESFSENMRPEQTSIVKVLLLQHIGKTEMFVKNTNQWEIEKRGKIYDFNPNLPALKLGTLSAIRVIDMGVKLTTEEFEAMTSIDCKDDDTQFKLSASILAHIVRQANDTTNKIIRESYKRNIII